MTVIRIDAIGCFQNTYCYSPPDPHDKAADYILSSDMEQNLALIGAQPRTGITQVRIHYLMQLISVDIDSEQISYNFTNLDRFLVRLKEFSLKPGFEIMGNPSQFFNDFENKTQVYEWKSLVKLMVSRYQKLLGRDYLRQWYFESWNEPSIEFKTHWRDGIKFTPQGFLNYYDACSQAIKEVDPELKFWRARRSLAQRHFKGSVCHRLGSPLYQWHQLLHRKEV